MKTANDKTEKFELTASEDGKIEKKAEKLELTPAEIEKLLRDAGFYAID